MDRYQTELKQLKEEAINRIEAYYRENEKYLNSHQKELFQTINSVPWKEHFRNLRYKAELPELERIQKELIDDFKNSEGNTRNFEEERKRIHEKHSRDNKDNYDNSGKNSPNSDKITQLKEDIEYLKKCLSDPNLTEREKESDQEKLRRLEKELAALENQSNSDENHSSKDSSVDEKDKKLSQLEAEIQQLKNQNSATQTPEQQAETQKKIAEKEKELEEVKKGEENENYESWTNWTNEQLTKEIQKIKSELEQLKYNKNIDNSEKKPVDQEIRQIRESQG